MPHKRGECRKASRSKYCTTNGPRRTPEPFGQAAYTAEDLGLGTFEAAQRLLTRGPETEWVNAIEGSRRSTMLWPVERGSFGRGFGYTRSHRPSLRHDGIDIGAPAGELVRSVNDGIVAYSDNGVTGYGNMIMVVHKDASVSFYCHHRANYVFAGQQVKRGQVLGEVGMTGIARGPHLHFEYHVDGRARDPMRLMVGRPSRDQVREMLLEI
jgi:murein DD-endopeptidase MepM/ murein hydrolase activator NlpD